MQDLAHWLEELGMSEYAQRFAENGIDFGVLPDLTDQDLKDIGVLLGHRRKILRAIGEPGNAPATAQAPISTLLATPSASAATEASAERRQVTVMFSDLVGSTALSARMDPEDLREVISAYQKRVAETVQRFDGYVAKYMGDGVLIFFGYPQAHEDDAERAVRAGLELITAVSALNPHKPSRAELRRDRDKRHRARRKSGVRCYSVEIGPEVLDMAVRLHWLTECELLERRASSAASPRCWPRARGPEHGDTVLHLRTWRREHETQFCVSTSERLASRTQATTSILCTSSPAHRSCNVFTATSFKCGRREALAY
jgi:SAM domain (Sterile alpha motif)/Adenylate and Guanylate cyclase catalytic domain